LNRCNWNHVRLSEHSLHGLGFFSSSESSSLSWSLHDVVQTVYIRFKIIVRILFKSVVYPLGCYFYPPNPNCKALDNACARNRGLHYTNLKESTPIWMIQQTKVFVTKKWTRRKQVFTVKNVIKKRSNFLELYHLKLANVVRNLRRIFAEISAVRQAKMSQRYFLCTVHSNFFKFFRNFRFVRSSAHVLSARWVIIV
jgi:hypothetical protein